MTGFNTRSRESARQNYKANDTNHSIDSPRGGEGGGGHLSTACLFFAYEVLYTFNLSSSHLFCSCCYPSISTSCAACLHTSTTSCRLTCTHASSAVRSDAPGKDDA
eukprot:m.9450 g.9450  ORF g.9450 m.9450 type:complete len:106 (+) comp5746_c0_seq1:1311-1628(+)